MASWPADRDEVGGRADSEPPRALAGETSPVKFSKSLGEFKVNTLTYLVPAIFLHIVKRAQMDDRRKKNV